MRERSDGDGDGGPGRRGGRHDRGCAIAEGQIASSSANNIVVEIEPMLRKGGWTRIYRWTITSR